jgi:type IV secretion system protein VirB10
MDTVPGKLITRGGALASSAVRLQSLALLLALALAACDDKPSPAPERKLTLPKGESTLDELIKKSQESQRSATLGRIEADPSTVVFSPVEPGSSASRQLRLINRGDGPVILGQLRVAGAAAAYAVGGTCAAGTVIEAGHSCAADIVFHPTGGGEAEGELVIEQVQPGGALFVPLHGDALALAAPARPPPPAVSSSADATTATNAQASFVFARTRQDGGFIVEGETPAPPVRPVGGARDYVEAGLPGIVSSSPVDRSRVVTADRYIPAVLENTINSQLPGRAIAVVERPVYGADGRLVLIPAGSRVIGHYQSLAKLGQARLDIGWTRIIRPDGVNINAEATGTDVMGRSGLPGDLDTRVFEKYGGSLLTSAIAAAGDWALDGSSTTVLGPLGGTTQSLSGRARAATRLGNDLDTLGQQIVRDNVDIRPVLTVPEGTRLNIVPTEDLWLRDPNHLAAVTPPKGRAPATAQNVAGLAQLLPSLVELAAENPALQKVAPQTAQQILQSTLLQQLRQASEAETSSSQPTSGPAQAAVRR